MENKLLIDILNFKIFKSKKLDKNLIDLLNLYKINLSQLCQLKQIF